MAPALVFPGLTAYPSRPGARASIVALRRGRTAVADSLLSSIGLVIALSIGMLTFSSRQPAVSHAPTADLQGAPVQIAAVPGRTIRRGADGLFRVEAQINGTPVQFIVDTGANVTVLCAADARRAGLLDGRLVYDERIEAGGGRVPAARTMLARATVMDKNFTDLPVVVARARFPVSVIGQDLLRRLPPFLIGGDALVLNATRTTAVRSPS